ncbi:uncharacterized protein LOC132200583 isoform X2 [Neocloeon triangulifer]|uniref:uncharacterized protein LOC132200583 isoform X2 n=1 Tax=Neocloeon triangulifer TaxID=2078957 RepID=UPI00286ECC4F|nr:uncharacterized protein LOC132200583 isoform X2 [Neocloeon triangulifer]
MIKAEDKRLWRTDSVEKLTMARFFLLHIVLLVAAALANESSNKPPESEFQQEMLKNLNKTNEKLDRLMRIVYNQVVETRRAAEEQNEAQIKLEKNVNITNEKLERLRRIVYDQPMEMRKLAEEQNEAQIKLSNATNDQLTKAVDRRHNQTLEGVKEAVKILKETTFERFIKLEKQIDQTLESLAYVKQAEKRQNQELAALTNLTESHIQIFQTRFLPHCNLARSSKLTLLSSGKMYFFSYPTQTNWTFANETCAKKGLHLATIRDQNEALTVAAEGKRIYSNGWWVSAKNQGSRNDFRWSDGTKLELDSPLWMDNADKKTDCVLIYHGWNKGKLNGFECTNIRPFVCELPSECY